MTDDAGAALELVILGAGPAYSDVPGSLGAGYLVRTPDEALVLDLGQGCFPSLASLVEPADLRAVLISHLHPDHFIDLIPLRHYLRRAEADPDRRVAVHAPDGLADRLDGAWGAAGFSAAAFVHEPLHAGSLRVGTFDIEVRPVRHAGEAFAFRVSVGGHRAPGIVYSGDVGEADDLAPLVRPGDLLLSEASYGPGPVPDGMPHLDAPAVARVASDTGAGQVVVTHVRMGTDLSATMASLRSAYRGPASLARPGSRYLVASVDAPPLPRSR